MKQYYVFVIFIVSLLLTACSNTNDTRTIDYYSYELDNNSTSLIADRSSQINIYAHYSNGETQTVNDQFTWQSSDESAATVSSGGLVTASSLQTNVTISFVSQERLPDGAPIYQNSVAFSIKSLNLTSISISPSTLTGIDQGVEKSLVATGVFDDNSTYTVTDDCTWSSDDDSVVSVIAKGKIKALSEGNATITATDTTSNISTSIQVKVNKSTYTDLNISASTTEFNKDETIQLSAVATNSDAERIILSSAITWKSSDSSIVSIDTNGLATALTKGDVNITATIDNTSIVSNSVELSVKKEKWLRILNNDSNQSIYLPYAKDYNLTQEGLDTNQTLATFTFNAVGSDFTLYNIAITDFNGYILPNAYFYVVGEGNIYASSYTIPQDTNKTIQLIRYTTYSELKYYFSLESTSVSNDFKVTYHN